ncbi:MAG: dihydropyrimidinase [Planctomycetota bacterium]|jgi:dihydropyrimidinase
MGLLIRNGRIITPDQDRIADIYCAGEHITRIEPAIDPDSLADANLEIIDATGKLILPGAIDPHVHIHLPFMGTNARDDHASASKAALAGGTTTYIEMICPGPDDEPLDAFNDWASRAQGHSACDYSFHMSVVRFREGDEQQFRTIVQEHGIASFKVFLAYKGALDLGDEDLYKAMSLASELGVIVTAHCENAEAIDAMQQRLLQEGNTGPQWHEPSRPPCVEAEGVSHICTFAELTGAHVYAVHTSCQEAIRAGVEAKQRGVKVWIEAVAPHLVLDKSYAELPEFEGAKYVMSPPLREPHNNDALWGALRTGLISTVGTDHAPFDFKGQKDMGRDAFTQIPNGIPGIQERVDLLHTHGVRAGRIDMPTLVRVCSEMPARIFGMFPRKGAVAVGSDADLVVYDPSHEGIFSASESLSQVDYCAYEGWKRQGRADVVTVRGKVQARQGEFVGDEAHGTLIKRQPTHF